MCMHSGLRGWNMSSISILTCLQVICTCWLVLGLRVLESNLLMRNGSVMMVTAMCLLHALTCTHNTNKCTCTLYLPTYTRAHTPPTPAHKYIRTYLRTYIHTYIHLHSHNAHMYTRSSRMMVVLSATSIHQTSSSSNTRRHCQTLWWSESESCATLCVHASLCEWRPYVAGVCCCTTQSTCSGKQQAVPPYVSQATCKPICLGSPSVLLVLLNCSHRHLQY